MVPTTSCSGCATSGPSMHWWSLISDVTAWNRAKSEVRLGVVVAAGGFGLCFLGVNGSTGQQLFLLNSVHLMVEKRTCFLSMSPFLVASICPVSWQVLKPHKCGFCSLTMSY